MTSEKELSKTILDAGASVIWLSELLINRAPAGIYKRIGIAYITRDIFN
jgi:hypothetical protein